MHIFVIHQVQLTSFWNFRFSALSSSSDFSRASAAILNLFTWFSSRTTYRQQTTSSTLLASRFVNYDQVNTINSTLVVHALLLLIQLSAMLIHQCGTICWFTADFKSAKWPTRMNRAVDRATQSPVINNSGRVAKLGGRYCQLSWPMTWYDDICSEGPPFSS